MDWFGDHSKRILASRNASYCGTNAKPFRVNERVVVREKIELGGISAAEGTLGKVTAVNESAQTLTVAFNGVGTHKLTFENAHANLQYPRVNTVSSIFKNFNKLNESNNKFKVDTLVVDESDKVYCIEDVGVLGTKVALRGRDGSSVVRTVAGLREAVAEGGMIGKTVVIAGIDQLNNTLRCKPIYPGEEMTLVGQLGQVLFTFTNMEGQNVYRVALSNTVRDFGENEIQLVALGDLPSQGMNQSEEFIECELPRDFDPAWLTESDLGLPKDFDPAWLNENATAFRSEPSMGVIGGMPSYGTSKIGSRVEVNGLEGTVIEKIDNGYMIAFDNGRIEPIYESNDNDDDDRNGDDDEEDDEKDGKKNGDDQEGDDQQGDQQDGQSQRQQLNDKAKRGRNESKMTVNLPNDTKSIKMKVRVKENAKLSEDIRAFILSEYNSGKTVEEIERHLDEIRLKDAAAPVLAGLFGAGLLHGAITSPAEHVRQGGLMQRTNWASVGNAIRGNGPASAVASERRPFVDLPTGTEKPESKGSEEARRKRTRAFTDLPTNENSLRDTRDSLVNKAETMLTNSPMRNSSASLPQSRQSDNQNLYATAQSSANAGAKLVNDLRSNVDSMLQMGKMRPIKSNSPVIGIPSSTMKNLHATIGDSKTEGMRVVSSEDMTGTIIEMLDDGRALVAYDNGKIISTALKNLSAEDPANRLPEVK